MNPEQILKQADTCVKCGLCLPHCPTYRLSANEAESPRGRIALAQGLLGGALQDSPKLHAHLDRCLSCGACEAMCPSLVPYTRILDGMREHRVQGLSPAPRQLRKLLLNLAIRPGPLPFLLRLYRRSGVQAALRASGLARLIPMERLAVEIPRPQSRTDKQRKPAGQPILLFPGCVGRHLDSKAHAAASRILERLGYQVDIPVEPMCCGALHRHEGFPAEASHELAHARQLLRAAGTRRILTLASACQGELARDTTLAPLMRDATRFLADLDWPADLPLNPLTARVLIHVPCTQRNLLGDPAAAADLLRRIPGLDMVELQGEGCCGAAGTYLLREPDLSGRLLEVMIQDLSKQQTTLVVTTNTGCALQLKSGIEAAGLEIEVLHPVELLARQLPKQSFPIRSESERGAGEDLSLTNQTVLKS